jgi:hypothetical protein
MPKFTMAIARKFQEDVQVGGRERKVAVFPAAVYPFNPAASCALNQQPL